ncbi:MAG: phytoene desaturase family protein [Ilumatobacteraceae bacterium]
MTVTCDVAVVGGGVGGIMSAIRLASAGRHVMVFERNDELGGKLSSRSRDGYTFDTGPSLLTLPSLIDDVFRLAGTSLDSEVTLQRLDPSFHYFWPDASTVTFRDQPISTAEALEAFSPGSGAEYLALLARARGVWNVSERTFFAGDISSPLSLLRRMQSPRDLLRIDALRTLQSRCEASFGDKRLQQWLARYATYSGSDPSLAPATLACIAAVEADFGSWYVHGGLGALRDAMVRVARRAGVEFRLGAEVVKIEASQRRVTGLRLPDDQIVAPVVVVNADAEHLYRDVLPHPKRLRAVERTERSTSGIAVLVGVEGRTPLIGHHNVWFSRDYGREFADIRAGRVPTEPTIYGCISSMTDPSQAPANGENWFLLINTPADPAINARDCGPWLLDQLAAVGPDLRQRARFAEVIGPHDIAMRYRSPGGAIYGTSSNGRRAAFRRPAIRGPRKGLYLVGGSTHPGGGLPLVTMSARMVSNMILRTHRER